MQEIDDYIDKVQNLPPAPKVLLRLMGMLSSPDTDTDQVADLIRYDPAMTAGVLRACNSAYFASSSPVTDLNEAINRLGFQTIFRIITAISAGRTLYPKQKGYGIDEGELWKHSVATAVGAQLIAHELNEDESTVFTTALLHDLGKIILADVLENIYLKLIEEVETHQQAMLETEKKLLGVQHAEVGGRLLQRWGFPEPMVAAVWHHHHPMAAVGAERLASMVYLGDMIAHFMGMSFGHQAYALRGRTEALELLKISGDQLPYFMIKTFENIETIEALHNIHA